MMIKISKFNVLAVFVLLTSLLMYGQQDPQFTHYTYNTMAVNPAYSGSRGHFAITALHREQWVGLEGAPRTSTLGIDTPLKKNVGLGVSVIQDELGPSNETFLDANFSYTLRLDEARKRHLSFGIKGGLRFFNVDWSKGTYQNQSDVLFSTNINKTFPVVGAGIYYHTDRFYAGASIPNFLTDQHYDEFQQALAFERMHFFFIGGYVFDIASNTKFKPAFLVKAVDGAPLIFDLSGNFLINEKLTLGASYRWDDSIAGLVGFQLSPKFHIGYSYDFTATELQQHNDGTHEILLRFELLTEDKKLKSPRFF